MTIEIEYFFNDMCSSTYNSGVGVVFTNLLYTSILLSIIILLVVCFTYPVKKGTPLFVTFKLIFYVFISVLVVVGIHYGMLESKFEGKYKNDVDREILQAVKGGKLNSMLAGDKRVPITPILRQRDENAVDVAADDDRADNMSVNNNVEDTIREGDQMMEDILKGTYDGSDVKVTGSSVDQMLDDTNAV